MICVGIVDSHLSVSLQHTPFLGHPLSKRELFIIHILRPPSKSRAQDKWRAIPRRDKWVRLWRLIERKSASRGEVVQRAGNEMVLDAGADR